MIQETLITFWLLFASIHSGLPIPTTKPLIIITNNFEGHHLGNIKTDPAGLTSFRTGLIALPLNWKSSPEGQCVLAHELTHFLQYQNGIRGNVSAIEPPAYQVQADCLASYNLKKEQAWILHLKSHFYTGNALKD